MGMEDLYFEQIEEQNRQLEMEYFMEMQRESILTDRAPTHGDFTDNSRFVQASKLLLRSTPNWSSLEPYMQEAMDMTIHKYARALYGDFMFEDTFKDVVGYNQLIVDAMEKDERTTFIENVKYKVDENGVRINL